MHNKTKTNTELPQATGSTSLLYGNDTKKPTIIGILLSGRELSGRVLDSRLRNRGFEPHRRHCVVSLSKTH